MLLLWTFLWLHLGAAAAETGPVCVKKISQTTYQEPADLKALLVCQKKTLAHCAADYETRHEDLPPDETLENWREMQRREAQDFLRRHPEGASLPGKKAAQADPGQDGTGNPRPPDLQALQQDLWEKSDQGRKGITTDMAQEIVNLLIKQQGTVSADMSDLLGAVLKDGTNLSDDTFHRLQDAARKAEASGLDLGLSSDMKESLLQDKPTPEQPTPSKAPPGTD
jgi:hypothetical protein